MSLNQPHPSLVALARFAKIRSLIISCTDEHFHHTFNAAFEHNAVKLVISSAQASICWSESDPAVLRVIQNDGYTSKTQKLAINGNLEKVFIEEMRSKAIDRALSEIKEDVERELRIKAAQYVDRLLQDQERP